MLKVKYQSRLMRAPGGNGISLVFWRWGPDRELARDGMTPYIKGNLPQWQKQDRRPPPEKFARLLDLGHYSSGIDLVEMFHNFPLHFSIPVYSGIDLSHLSKELNIPPAWYRWTRNWMGQSLVTFLPFSSTIKRKSLSDTITWIDRTI
jgi:hypothetical protein